jgi:phosphonate transport system ATP-binding protein
MRSSHDKAVDAGVLAPASTLPQPVVRIEGVSKSFSEGRVVALDNVTLQVPRGQLLVLIGLSGSGKSTLLRTVNGLNTVDSGVTEVLGVGIPDADRATLKRVRRDIGFIFQQLNLVGRLTCIENVLQGALGRLRGPRYGVVSYAKELRKEALGHLERVGLADRAFQRVDTLSGGQQQRVGIARALMQRPQIILADEPVASLDPESSEQVMETLFRICSEEELTVMCSLHQVDLALGWADRIVGLRSGRIVMDHEARSLTAAEALEVYARDDEAQVAV